MLSYQHGYHAGNFADVIKHVTLTRLINYMTQKDKPVFYLETHSGSGLYDLRDSKSGKTGEYHQGIGLLWPQRKQWPDVFSCYRHSLINVNPNRELRYYPGSPAIAIEHFRSQDRLFFCELHPQEFACLQRLPHDGKRVFLSESDGISRLTSQLPPPERRGLIFIDPSYEVKTEYKHIPQAINSAFQRFATGIYCLWYPLVDPYCHQQLLREMNKIPVKNKLRIEFSLTPTPGSGMWGCGLWIINPPYVLAEEMKVVLTCLKSFFNPKQASFLLES
ncbi:23S rRNA (adenine(2030)-N(6))-methyltransferase RlmJ [Legionella spiritensis]|uniref:23S rRNA (adenine(2030)-N(6))-methyltransferase RlmJ n=1 Tax=Legionella spiritensis TaxID=452 RepID=UPI000F6C3FBB|nr:23S rRNA (adenine(2030)-N(6))-methyltransferase RlmJ [Legionella spiritensis]VEG89862.1 protein involved in catabolism of external DNA [Legionella spiritensis]